MFFWNTVYIFIHQNIINIINY